MAMNTYNNDELNILANFSANYEIVKNVRAGVRLLSDYSGISTFEILHPESILGPYQAAGSNLDEYGGIHEEASQRDFRFNGLYSLGYSNVFNEKHTVSATAFFEYNKAHRLTSFFEQRGLDPKFVGTGAAFIPGTTVDVNTEEQDYIPTIGSNNLVEGMLSYFATGSYDYDQKYSFVATVRRDGSFRFTEDNRWGTFWSIGAAWNIDKEDFMADSGFSYLKLRGSYGTNGNQNVTGGQFGGLSITRSLYGSGVGYGGTVGMYPTTIGYSGLVWETSEQANIGVDFGIFDNKLSGSIDVYQKTTKDLYNIMPVSLTNATSSINANIGSMVNKGIELDLKYIIVDNDDWNVS